MISQSRIEVRNPVEYPNAQSLMNSNNGAQMTQNQAFLVELLNNVK